MSASIDPTTGIDCAPMRECDLDEVVAAELRIYAFPWSRGNFADSLTAGYSAWVCRDSDEGGRLSAYAVFMLVLDEAHLLNLSVVPERRRQGLGSRLLRLVFDAGRRHGARRIYLEVRESNSAGIALYERHDFAIIGRRRAYYPADQGREDAITMVKNL